jgi:hypothetical protein
MRMKREIEINSGEKKNTIRVKTTVPEHKILIECDTFLLRDQTFVDERRGYSVKKK